MFETISNSDLIALISVLAISATVSGFMAGLLGVGGGIIMVPALYFAFETLHFDPQTIMHLSLGTSLAIIIPTSIMSTKTHMEFNAVDFKLIKSFGLFVAGGVLLGTVFASNLETPKLVLFFSVFAFCVGIFFIFFREKLGENPKNIPLKIKSFIGTCIGFISVPLGIGGGSISVPFMRLFGYSIRNAIGTSAALGFIISVVGALTMSFSGSVFDEVKSPLSIGYVNIPGFLVFVPVTMIMAPIGARLVHKIEKKLLSRIFGLFLIIIAIRSFIEYLTLN
ncbi:MAG: sulfite exporter TauE/SafE family protein [Pelagibacteraceae bacterium]